MAALGSGTYFPVPPNCRFPSVPSSPTLAVVTHKRMNAKNIIYWIATVLVCAAMGMASYEYLTHAPKMMTAFATLGYPYYFPNILGVFKILGIIALLAPRFALLKEWAYAGFTFTFIGAFVSHLAAGQNSQAVAPVVMFVLLAISYVLRPATRRNLQAPPTLSGAYASAENSRVGWASRPPRQASCLVHLRTARVRRYGAIPTGLTPRDLENPSFDD